jgi:hypothetical protein
MQVFALPNHGESGKIKLALPKSGRWLAPRRFSFGKFPEGHKLFVPLRKSGKGGAQWLHMVSCFSFAWLSSALSAYVLHLLAKRNNRPAPTSAVISLT